MMYKFPYYVLLCTSLCVACNNPGAKKEAADGRQVTDTNVRTTYQNPVIRIAAPDPTALRDVLPLWDGRYSESSYFQIEELGGLGRSRDGFHRCDAP